MKKEFLINALAFLRGFRCPPHQDESGALGFL